MTPVHRQHAERVAVPRAAAAGDEAVLDCLIPPAALAGAEAYVELAVPRLLLAATGSRRGLDLDVAAIDQPSSRTMIRPFVNSTSSCI
jgi:hypothetical protein